MTTNWTGVVITVVLLASGIALLALHQEDMAHMVLAAAMGTLAPTPFTKSLVK